MVLSHSALALLRRAGHLRVFVSARTRGLDGVLRTDRERLTLLE
jgi:hypothetical protein